MNFSNTSEANVSFVRDAVNVGTDIEYALYPIAGLALGYALGRALENHVTVLGTADRAANHIGNIQNTDYTIGQLIAGPQDNPGYKQGLRQTLASNKQEIAYIRSHTPHTPGTLESVAFQGGGSLVGAVAMISLATFLYRNRRSSVASTSKA
jgi:hypothetical protein